MKTARIRQPTRAFLETFQDAEEKFQEHARLFNELSQKVQELEALQGVSWAKFINDSGQSLSKGAFFSFNGGVVGIAKADAWATRAWGIVLESVGSLALFKGALLHQSVEVLTVGDGDFTKDDPVWLSDDFAGRCQRDRPTTAGRYAQLLGYALEPERTPGRVKIAFCPAPIREIDTAPVAGDPVIVGDTTNEDKALRETSVGIDDDGNISGAGLTLTTPLPPASGGTGISSYAVGDILYASGATTLSKLADIATGNALITGGVGAAPSYGKIGLTTHVSGTLPVANGGTGIASYAVGDLIYASGATTLVALADVAAGSYLRSGGVTTAPLWSTLVLPNSVSAGALFYGTSSNVMGSLTIGAANRVLFSDGSNPSWSGTPTVTTITLNSAAAGGLLYTGVNGGGGSGIQYTDSGATARYAMRIASDVIYISNRASNGTVQITANTSTAGSGGEVNVALFEDDRVKFVSGYTLIGLGALTLSSAAGSGAGAAGSNLTIEGGDGGGSGNANGGTITLNAGIGDGTGQDGNIALNAGGGGSGLGGTVIISAEAVDVTGSSTFNNAVTINGEPNGERLIFTGVRQAITASGYINADGLVHTATVCWDMPTSGSVTRLSVTVNETAHTTNGTISLHAYKNGASVYSITTATITGVAVYRARGSQARGTDTFVAGDVLSMYVNFDGAFAGTVTVVATMEVIFD